MLIYATIFIASIIVAAVIIFLYKTVSNSSRSVYSSREHLAILDVQPKYQKDRVTVNGMPDFPRNETHATPRHNAKTHPAKPTETVDWGWKDSSKQSQQATATANSSHCSLYDMKPEGRIADRNGTNGWLRREERSEAAGKVYKVKRQAFSRSPGSGDTGKPWGW